MNWWQFGLDFADIVAWPITVLALAWIFREPLRSLRKRLTEDIERGRPVGIGPVQLPPQRPEDESGAWTDLDDTYIVIDGGTFDSDSSPS